MTDLVPDLSEGKRRIYEAVIGGAALSRFQAMLEAQGVAREVAAQLCSAHTDYFKVLRKSEYQLELQSGADGKNPPKNLEHLTGFYDFKLTPFITKFQDISRELRR